ncbi:hypothetical protein ACIBEK_18895 [Nocardia fusca]|uniref:hypothetical protein n=1 Tax=Nocardia fusca TaxID=941183 RepID=UPI0037BD51F2
MPETHGSPCHIGELPGSRCDPGANHPTRESIRDRLTGGLYQVGENGRFAVHPHLRRTRAGDWLAVWRFDHLRIRILRVCDTSGAQTLLSATGLATAPDLADMRERFPELTGLWDAVRHEFWAETAREGLPG